ncbi:hypothetical protein HJFPF1_10947 [Paramyrothecium foliicola]|nr:hypothetical protein HJFPF1_10947 [Paramyrothecium foliicola]
MTVVSRRISLVGFWDKFKVRKGIDVGRRDANSLACSASRLGPSYLGLVLGGLALPRTSHRDPDAFEEDNDETRMAFSLVLRDAKVLMD